ncbi:MAG: alpha/beta hydrolase [Panacagrimonas sp.]|nr:alpha/beta hydrolase [Panacagrimonas sp.]MCC2658172.1 alpha/beta hydrolase [Panacagrimonas sp.]
MRRLITGLTAILLLSFSTGCTTPGALNALTPTRGYDLAANIPYDTSRNLRLDIYSPQGVQNAPVVLFFYGGRWTSGTKDDYRFVGEALSSRGFIGVIADYRLYPQVRFPEFVDDGARAVAWLHSNARTYGGSPDKIFVMGHQSGAHIAAMLAIKEEYMSRAGGSRSWLRGMIGLAGAYDFLPITDPTLRDIFAPPEKYERSQPVLYAEGDNPPMLLMHGEDDDNTEIKNTRSLAAAVKKAGGPIETVIYPKMSHRMIIASLAKPIRGQTDVLGHVSEFVTRWSNTARGAERPSSDGQGVQGIPMPID